MSGNLALDIASADPWQAEIEQDAIRAIRVEPCNAASPFLDCGDRVAGHRQRSSVERTQPASSSTTRIVEQTRMRSEQESGPSSFEIFESPVRSDQAPESRLLAWPDPP